MSENVIEIINDNIILDIADENSDMTIVPENLISIDYTNAVNKPKINSVELVGNKSAAALGLVAVESMSAKEDIENKVTALDENSTDILYPSAKCVRDELLNKANVSLGNLSAAGQAIIDAKADTDLSNLSLVGQGIIDAKADTDLSNLSVTGQAVIDAKADVDGTNMAASVKNFDGQWIGAHLTLVSNKTVSTGGQTYTDYDISSYLPNDNYKYEVWVSMAIECGNHTWDWVRVECESPNLDLGIWTGGITITNAGQSYYARGFVPIDTDRKLRVGEIATGNAGKIAEIKLLGYRRIGTNQ